MMNNKLEYQCKFLRGEKLGSEKKILNVRGKNIEAFHLGHLGFKVF